MRPSIDLAYRLRLRILALLRWRTRGVKVMAYDTDGRLLLVRHRYGRSDLWMLPGGGVARGETPAAAAIRELAEETGCTLSEVVPLATFVARGEGRRDTVHLFRGVAAGALRIDGVELAAAAFFAPDELPAALSPATARRIEEHAAARLTGGDW